MDLKLNLATEQDATHCSIKKLFCAVIAQAVKDLISPKKSKNIKKRAKDLLFEVMRHPDATSDLSQWER
jgi:hypothetical protein